jgi:hypothetical protein
MKQGQAAFVVISGLPGSGKSTLAWGLSPLLRLPVVDKDDTLEKLFDEKGTGDAAWRRMLSRESDALFEGEAAMAVNGAILVSFWHLPGMQGDSGTATDWIGELSGNVVQVHCECPAEMAAKRFFTRQRHPGYPDEGVQFETVLARIEEVAGLGLPRIGRRVVSVDTSQEVDFEALAKLVRD